MSGILASTRPDLCPPERDSLPLVSVGDEDGVLSVRREPGSVHDVFLFDHPDGGVTVASSVRSLLRLPRATDIDPIGIAATIAYGHAGTLLTCFRRIRRLSRGVTYRWTLGHDAHVSLTTTRAPRDLGVTAPTRRAAAGVVLLSGGAGSATVARELARTTAPISAMTISFPGLEHLDESPRARSVAVELDAQHDVVPGTVDNLAAELDLLTVATGEPIVDPAAVALGLLASRSRSPLLTGHHLDRDAALPRAVRHPRRQVGGPLAQARTLVRTDVLAAAFEHRTRRTRHLALDLTVRAASSAAAGATTHVRAPLLERNDRGRHVAAPRSHAQRDPLRAAVLELTTERLRADMRRAVERGGILDAVLGRQTVRALEHRLVRAPDLVFRTAALARWAELCGANA